LQAIGFLADFILFLLPAALWGTLTGSVTGTKVFQFIYFFSSFWNQFGPNCTTFLVAGERLLCTLCMPCRLLFQKPWQLLHYSISGTALAPRQQGQVDRHLNSADSACMPAQIKRFIHPNIYETAS